MADPLRKALAGLAALAAGVGLSLTGIGPVRQDAAGAHPALRLAPYTFVSG